MGIAEPSIRGQGPSTHPTPAPIFASIGTVLVDCFDRPPRHTPDTRSPASTRPATPNEPSLTSSLTAVAVHAAAAASGGSGALTPQRSFASDDTIPSSSSSISGASDRSSATSASGPIDKDDEPIEVLGGGALYALVGARVWLPPAQCRTLVDTDEERRDLSKDLEDEMEGYGAGCWAYLEGGGRRMIRARIRYEGSARLYKHLVPPRPRSFASLCNTAIDGASYLHISPPYSPEDVCRLIAQQRDVRASDPAGGCSKWKPKIVFEPTPASCHADQRIFLEQILPDLEILSPNHEEILSIYSRPIHALTSPLLRPAVEDIINHVLSLGVGEQGSGAVVVRCGFLGAVVGTRARGIKWFPAYWRGDEESRVRDVTGGGNAYLGGLIAGLSISNADPYEAAQYAMISASLVVEQIGLPKLETLPQSSGHPDPADEGQISPPRSAPIPQGLERRPAEVRGETWNGDVPEWRLELYRRRQRDEGDKEELAA